MVAFPYRLPSGILGNVTRIDAATVEAQIYNASNMPGAFGLPVAIDANGVRPIGGSDTAATVAGVLVRPFPTSGNGTDGLGTATPQSAAIANVLKRGYITAKLNGATAAAKDGTVYVRIANASSGKPVGGFEAAADSGNTVTLPAQWYFTGPADSSGNVEIAVNI